MNCFEKIFGNEEQIRMFSSLIESGTMSHAYMLTGPKGSGKKTFAFAVAAAIAEKRNGS
ncbi:MAG: DNA polymerase III subunit delta, partial [Clostridiales bacterium]|nr:DNA polymerase III subunit delta [Clostridiales bacterium]